MCALLDFMYILINPLTNARRHTNENEIHYLREL